MKHHNMSDETLENDSVTSFNLLADVSLCIGMLVFVNDDNLWQVLHYLRILSSSHAHIMCRHMRYHGYAEQCADNSKLQGSALCKQTAMSHMRCADRTCTA